MIEGSYDDLTNPNEKHPEGEDIEHQQLEPKGSTGGLKKKDSIVNDQNSFSMELGMDRKQTNPLNQGSQNKQLKNMDTVNSVQKPHSISNQVGSSQDANMSSLAQGITGNKMNVQ